MFGKGSTKRHPLLGLHWRQVVGWGALLAAGTAALEWLDYKRVVRTDADQIYIFLIALGALALGIYIGARVIAPPAPLSFDGNPKAQAALGISPRELTVLKALAAGQSNKEIARELHLSPHTVKTHVARLFEKLEAKRRTDAIQKAREIGLLP